MPRGKPAMQFNIRITQEIVELIDQVIADRSDPLVPLTRSAVAKHAMVIGLRQMTGAVPTPKKPPPKRGK
jgi:hypothetical protein